MPRQSPVSEPEPFSAVQVLTPVVLEPFSDSVSPRVSLRFIFRSSSGKYIHNLTTLIKSSLARLCGHRLGIVSICRHVCRVSWQFPNFDLLVILSFVFLCIWHRLLLRSLPAMCTAKLALSPRPLSAFFTCRKKKREGAWYPKSRDKRWQNGASPLSL